MEWVYKSTDSKLDRHGTLILAQRGFLYRSAHTKTGDWIPNVQGVQLGDTLHVYQRTTGKTRTVGSFEVVGSEGHRQAAHLGERVEGTALFVVEDTGFVTEVDKTGEYQPDPVVGKMTGWLLKSKGRPPPYRDDMFGRMQTLAPHKPA
jgi:hypothetical protein